MARFGARLAPGAARDQLRFEYDIRGSSITLYECRAPWNVDLSATWTATPIAQLRYDAGTGRWSLYARTASDRGHRDDRAGSAREVDVLLAAVERDENGMYLG